MPVPEKVHIEPGSLVQLPWEGRPTFFATKSEKPLYSVLQGPQETD